MPLQIRIHEGYRTLPGEYLFSEVGRRVREYRMGHPEKRVISLGIGDVTLPLPAAAAEAMACAAREMAAQDGFHGYGPEAGYPFLREAIARYYATRGVTLSPTEIYVSDGAKSDLSNLPELLGDVPVLLPDPTYPVYRDVNLLSGRRIHLLQGNGENGFLPGPEGLTETGALIVLCSPGNPTGAVYDQGGLQKWVDFARQSGSLLLVDVAYEAFITGDAPHSVFEIPGARDCAIEVGSFSKMAGFTGVRCGFTIIPAGLCAGNVPLHRLWERRQATKCNGVSYITQRGAEAVLSPRGVAECRANIRVYQENARVLAALLTRKGIRYTGGENAPYLFLQTPGGEDSWAFFERLLTQAQVVGTPGSGFGPAGEGWFRLSALGRRDDTCAAAERLEEIL